MASGGVYMDLKSENIKFIDLEAQQKVIYSALKQRIEKVLSHGNYIMGPEVYELETELAEYVDVKYAITCSSGTDALLMALMAYGIGPGDAIFTTPFTFIATAEIIALLGAIPIFVDIDPKTFNIDPSKLELAIKALKENDALISPLPRINTLQYNIKGNQLKPRGIISVDLFGLPADYNQINSIAEVNNLFVLEDAAQGFGAKYQGKQTGNLTNIAATSFFPAKPLGCYGDGGAVFTNDNDLAAKIESIRVHGKGKEKYDNIRIGLNGRLDSLQAAVLLEKLKIFPNEIIERNRVAEKYSNELGGFVGIPSIPEGCCSVWAQYSIISNKRQQLQFALKQEGIPTAIYYPTPLHQQTAFSYLGYKTGDFPVSENISKEIFSLPMHPYLKDKQIEKIADIIKFNISN